MREGRGKKGEAEKEKGSPRNLFHPWNPTSEEKLPERRCKDAAVHAAADQDVRIPGERIHWNNCSAVLVIRRALCVIAIGHRFHVCLSHPPPESMLFQQGVCICARPPDETSFSLYPHVFLPRLFQECVYQKNPIPCFHPRICLTRKCRRQLKYSVDVCWKLLILKWIFYFDLYMIVGQTYAYIERRIL